MAGRLSHVGENRAARMVDVSPKPATERVARAEATVLVGETVAALIREHGGVGKGAVLETARLAGIQAAKRTWELVPLCHPIALDHVEVSLHLADQTVEIQTTARATARTGVEMEAMTAAVVAALTVYDMVKAASKEVEIQQVRLLEKSGGKSGHWEREPQRS